MRTLSKSKLLAWRQCPRRLWLEVHRPELREDSPQAQARFAAGHAVGELARRLYDPDGQAVLIEPAAGVSQALQRTREAIVAGRAVFEAGFAARGALVFADVLLPDDGGARGWRLVEVKSSTSLKDYHRDDVAIQAHVASAAGLPLTRVAVAHIDSSWTYPGGGDYSGLLVERDLTDEALACGDEVAGWIASARRVVAQPGEPRVATGAHCTDPFECGFRAHCRAGEPQAEYPADWLPRKQARALKALVGARPDVDMREVPDALLNAQQLRVKRITLAGVPELDVELVRARLAGHEPPLYFLDFESIAFAVPIWAGTRPYQQIPFQFSVHRVDAAGMPHHMEFLDLSGEDPSRDIARALLAACGTRGPVFVYNAGFERRMIGYLAERNPGLAAGLEALSDRLVDLLPVVRDGWYHPDQRGSWSLKAVLPLLVPDLSYDDLDGVQEGAGAQDAYLEAIADDTSPERRAELERQLRRYCALDTWAMVRIWQRLVGAD